MLTPKQAKVFSYVRRRADAGFPPTVREICREFGFRSTHSAHYYLQVLERKGRVQRSQGARTIRLCFSLPLLGEVCNGKFVPASSPQAR